MQYHGCLIQAGMDMDKPESWYTRYDSYPPYCSIPDEMDKRSIPPLRDVRLDVYGETRILHASAVIRHGARTPYSSSERCFPNDPDEAEWNCKLTTIMTPPSPGTVATDEGDQWSELDKSFFLFEKIYDALPYRKDGLSNELNGTCQVGQLLLKGYEQEMQNGMMLRDAYTYVYDTMDHDERMRLLELSFHEFSVWDPNHLRYRADHDQRTIMSGQVLLRGLFDKEVQAYFEKTGKYPTIPLHIADRERDIMGPSAKVCPRLADIQDQAMLSDEYQDFNNSKDSQDTRALLDEEVGNMEQIVLLDCLMTTICDDRSLPDVVDDYGEEDSWFQKLAEYSIKSYNLVMKYNNSEYARLAMGPLWAEMRDTWEMFLDNDENEDQPPATPNDIVPPRLAVYSGHDTTIMPLLASISPDLWNDTDWAPYASMLLIEIHEFIDEWNVTLFDSKYAFRLLYNGKVLTGKVPGCHSELEICDLKTLKNIIGGFATRSRDCSSENGSDESTKVFVQAKTLMATGKGILMFAGLILFGVVFGAAFAYVVLTGEVCGKRVISNTVVEDSSARMGLQDQTAAPNSYSEEEVQGFQDEPIVSYGT
eukprot:scaffold66_cov115-Cylindrotheca_fusiformis.AAC.10